MLRLSLDSRDGLCLFTVKEGRKEASVKTYLWVDLEQLNPFGSCLAYLAASLSSSVYEVSFAPTLTNSMVHEFKPQKH